MAKVEEGSSNTDSEDCLGKIREEKEGRLGTDTRDTYVAISSTEDPTLKTELKMETDTGCGKTILNKKDWGKVKGSI